MQPGEVQRWRFIDTSFRGSLNIRLQDHSLHEIALDGLYLGKIDTWSPAQSVELQPGYRSNVLVQASLKKGTYRLVDGASGAGVSLRGVAEDENLLAEIVIDGDPLDMQLPTDAEMATVDLYTQYLGFIGQFVMHCHILDHEDLGMMEIVEVVGEAPLPQGHGGHH